MDWPRTRARRQRSFAGYRGSATRPGPIPESGLSDRDLRLATLTFAMGGISAWVPTFLHRSAGLSVANASLMVGAITVVDGIAGTLTGGWMAQRWLRTNYRALYLLSFWSVVLTLPCGVLVFFGPRAWAIPALFAAEFFLFLNTGPLNAAIVNSVRRRCARRPSRSISSAFTVSATHFRRRSSAPSQRPLEPEHRAGSDVVSLVISSGDSAGGGAVRAVAG